MEGETRKKITAGVLAACLALAVAVLAILALYPSGSGARYVKSEVYGGTDMYTAVSHGDHTGWVNLNDTKNGTSATGVSWSNDTCTISAEGKYFLSSNLTANIVVTAAGDDEMNVVFCLNGYALTGTGISTKPKDGLSAIQIGNVGSESDNPTTMDVVFCLYDCGGGKSVNRYDLREDGLTYDFTSTDPGDGYVRGGLITGGYGTKYHAGGITVGRGCTLNMYGGTVAGNLGAGTSYGSGGIGVYNGDFNMYGGMVAGNRNDATGGYTGAGGVYAHGETDEVNVTMYGGEIRDNYSGTTGGGFRAGLSNIDVGTVPTTFKMYGGVIAGNYSASNGGGIGTTNKTSGTGGPIIQIYGGVIRDNEANGNGGGVCAVKSFSMSGGTIEGNVAGGTGGGVYASCNPDISGNPCVYGNHANGIISNLDLYSNSTSSTTSNRRYITLSSALTDGAKIGVTLNSYANGKITDGGTDYLSASVGYIISDDRSYGVHVTGSGTSAYLELYEL